MIGGWKLTNFKSEPERTNFASFKLPKKDRKLLKDYPEWHEREIQCRLIKIELENGESEILCTSLTDLDKYLYDDFEQLYHYRWNEEEAYKLLKCRIELENFSGKTAIWLLSKIFMLKSS